MKLLLICEHLHGEKHQVSNHQIKGLHDGGMMKDLLQELDSTLATIIIATTNNVADYMQTLSCM